MTDRSDLSVSGDDSPQSQLGTAEFWGKNYEIELENYETYKDPGEVWFGSSLKSKIVHWIMNNVSDKSKPILDIGCGNGHMLVQLNKHGNFSNLIGIDYVQSSIELSQKIFLDESIPPDELKLFVVDFLKSNSSSNQDVSPSHLFWDTYKGKIHLAMDKGTFDAICLNPNMSVESSRKKYIQALINLLAPNGMFLIASCNWTRDELLKFFEHSGPFKLHDSIDTPCIQFGGKVGNNVTCFIFKIGG